VKVAALFVQKNGCYYGLEDVDPWDIERDARLYACARWSLLAGLVEARGGRRRGDDDGCFSSALESVRRWGGVLEHPAHSKAFIAHGLSRPSARRWQACLSGGWTTLVDQGRYGFAAKKPTWLYVYGIDSPPALDWAEARNVLAPDRLARRTGKPIYPLDRMSSRRRSATPHPFRDLLISLARSTRTEGAGVRPAPPP